MANKRELTIRIIGDHRSGAQSLQAIADKSDHLSGRLGTLGDKVAGVGTKMTAFATLPIVAGLGAATNAASDLNETTSKAITVFGDASDEVLEFAEDADEGLGQSKKQALDATGAFGNMFTQLGIGRGIAADMSTEMVGLASDFASFHNADITEVLQSQEAAFRGEYDSVQKFVPTINAAAVEQKALQLGLAATTSELDNQDKALATHALLVEGAGAATGDFARTSDSLANQQRIARAELENTAAELGEHLLPIAQQALGIVRDLVGAFGDLSPEQQKAALAAAAVVASMGPLLTVGGNVIKVIGGIQGAYTKLGTGGSVAVVGVTLAVGALVKGLIDAERRADQLVAKITEDMDTTQWDSMYKTFQDLTREANAHVEAVQRTNEKYDLGKAHVKEFLENITPLPDKLRDEREAAEESTEEHARLRSVLETANRALDAFAKANGLSREEVEKLAETQKVDLTGSYRDITFALADAYSRTQQQSTATSELEAANETLSDKVATAEDKLKAFTTAVDHALGSTVSVTDASIRHQEAIADLSQALIENGTSMDLTTEKGRAVQAAFNDVIRSTLGEVDALVKAGQIAEGTAEHKAELVRRLEDLRTKFPQLKGPIDEHIARIQAIPDTKTTNVVVNVEKALQDLERLLLAVAKLPPNVFSQPGFDPNALIAESIPSFHGGGVFFAPAGRGEGLALLRDREVVLEPGQVPAGEVRIEQTVNINGLGEGVTIDDVRREVAAANRELVLMLKAGVR